MLFQIRYTLSRTRVQLFSSSKVSISLASALLTKQSPQSNESLEIRSNIAAEEEKLWQSRDDFRGHFDADDAAAGSDDAPLFIPEMRKKIFSAEKIEEVKDHIRKTIDLVRNRPNKISTSEKVGKLLHLCRHAQLKTEAFTLLDHAFSAGDSFEWISDVITAAVSFLSEENRVMEAITFLRSRKLRYIKSSAFEPIIIALILSKRNAELTQVRMFAENIAVRLTLRTHEALLRKYAHEKNSLSAERSLLLMHTQNRAEMISKDLAKRTFPTIFHSDFGAIEIGDGKADKEHPCPRCGMVVYISQEFPCMQFERRMNRRMWHVPVCEDPDEEHQHVQWFCCVPGASRSV